MPTLILSGVAWLLHLAVAVVLPPALLASYAASRAAVAGQPVPRLGALLSGAARTWRGSSFRIAGVSAVATTAPLLAAAASLAAIAIVPGFYQGAPGTRLADPIAVAVLLLTAEMMPVLAALAVATSALGRAASGVARELPRRFAALLLIAFAAVAVGDASLDAGLSEATPAGRAILVTAALVAVAQAGEALRGAPALLAELGGPDLVLLGWAAAARAAALLTLAHDLALPWLPPLAEVTDVSRWPGAMVAWIATVLLAGATLGATAARATPARAGRIGWVAVAAGVLVAALVGQTP